MKSLRTVPLSENYYADIQKEVDKIFWDAIYSELVKQLKNNNLLENVKISRILQAIKSGKIQYSRGEFTGSFSSTVSRKLQELGATYNPKKGSYTLPRNKLTIDLIGEIEIAKQKMIGLHEDMIESLQIENIRKAVDESSLMAKYEKSVNKMEADWKKAARPLGITPDFTDEMRENIASNYTTNMEKYIVDWSENNIIKLREQIQQNLYDGARATTLAKTIQKNYGVSKSKALFLARQESSLLLAQYKKERYGTVGITKYKWSTSRDASVRSDHRRLNGKIFFYDEPPVVNLKTGARANPGEDFGCRCNDVPIYE